MGDRENLGSGDVPEEEDNNSYYSFLNLRKDASQEEIRAAYRKISKMYHPDKHLEEDKKEKAQVVFSKLSEAYSVLSDPYKRAIYDTLGAKGLAEQDWSIIKRIKTPEDIREEHELHLKRQEARLLLSQTTPSTSLKVHVDATELFERYMYPAQYDGLIPDRIPSLHVTEFSINKSISASLSPRDVLTFGGSVNSRNGTGFGHISGSWTRTRNAGDEYTRAGIVIGDQRSSIDVSWNKKIFGRHFINLSGAVQFPPEGLGLDYKIQLVNVLGGRTYGYLSFNSKNHAVRGNNIITAYGHENVSTEIVHSGKDYKLRANVTLHVSSFQLLFGISRTFLEHPNQVRLDLSLKAGSSGASVEYGIQGKINKFNALGAKMIVSYPNGVTLELTLKRSTQLYAFPIHLCDDIVLQPIVYGTMVPLLTYYTIKKMVLEPIARRKKLEEEEKDLKIKLAKILEDRKEAIAVIDLMQNGYNRIKNEEENINGLVIELSLYGALLSDGGGLKLDVESLLEHPESLRTFPDIFDVTVPVQCLVESGSRLSIHENTKSGLPGFYKPIPDVEGVDEATQCYLLIRYRYRSNLHQVLCKDNEALKLPKSTHKL